MTMHLETRAIHAPAAELDGSHPVSTPIYQTSVFTFDNPATCARALDDPDAGFAYSRYANPTTRALEAVAADLEGGAAALATSSGMGAINAVLLGSLRPGDHVIAQQCLYGGTFAVFTTLAARYGIDVSYVSGRDPAEVTAAASDRSRLLFLETIANPTIAVSDLPALIGAGHQAGLTCVVDNTFATPVLCRPIEHGADIVVHSATKYLGGHDDLTLGLVISAREEVHRPLWKHTVDLGVAADPFAAWLTLRGLKTLALRMERHCASARWTRQACARRASMRGASACRSGRSTPMTCGRTSSRPSRGCDAAALSCPRGRCAVQPGPRRAIGRGGTRSVRGCPPPGSHGARAGAGWRCSPGKWRTGWSRSRPPRWSR